jgi:NADPH2:quinone reductase
MQGLSIEVIGQPARLSELPPPERAPGDALLRVRAVPLNPADIAIAAGPMFAGHPPPPYVPGIEVVGEVIASDSHAAGTLVFSCLDGLGVARNGACAELAVAYDRSLIALPPGTEPLVAAAAGTAPLAAWISLTWRAPVRSDDTVVVLGATGSVGLVAVQAAKLLGAGRVVAVGRDADRLGIARSRGADAVIALDDGRGLVEAIRAESGNDGPTLIFDLLWGEPVVAALQTAAHGARVLNLGQSASPEAVIASSLIRGKNLDLLGYTNFSVPFDVLMSSYLALLGHLEAGRIVVDVESYPLAAAADAWQRQAAGPGAKLVISP